MYYRRFFATYEFYRNSIKISYKLVYKERERERKHVGFKKYFFNPNQDPLFFNLQHIER
jgi:hypothetical protein